ncbi:glutathione peroxidase [Zooshikella harenae]|uniref:Glutathione peroxidase n=1 Tax=Zooshikella harenae TaxID=2827238 RepID=A0ABS5ZH27_9GAMM|nr:glutathione peroxidase [Zooshikella harenae]MBU2713364.1 glutathione peroxidase [Zooshikella harenae]
MRLLLITLLPLYSFAVLATCPDYLNVTLRKLHSQDSINLCQLTAGKPVLIVNTASHCGFTPQFKALETLHKHYKDKGLVVLGFPSNDFRQEASDEAKTAKVCYVNYGVTFTMLSPSSVTGDQANAVFKYLATKAEAPKWNFYKYLVSADGSSVKAFASATEPNSDSLLQAIDDLL